MTKWNTHLSRIFKNKKYQHLSNEDKLELARRTYVPPEAKIKVSKKVGKGKENINDLEETTGEQGKTIMKKPRISMGSKDYPLISFLDHNNN
jgi:hypothetical protein